MLEKNYSKINTWLKTDFKERFIDDVKDEITNILINNDSSSKDLCNSYLREIAYIIHKFSQKPWTTQKTIIEKLDITKEVLIKIYVCFVRKNH